MPPGGVNAPLKLRDWLTQTLSVWTGIPRSAAALAAETFSAVTSRTAASRNSGVYFLLLVPLCIR